jgi:cytochrome P450 family 110
MKKLPPGPPESAWEQAKQWIERPVEFWSMCHAEYGDIFTLQLGSLGPTVLFCDPLAVRDVFALPRDDYRCANFNDHYRLIMGNRSLLALDGDTHSEQRHLLTPSFTPDAIQGVAAHLTNAVDQALDQWQPGEIIPVRRFVHSVVFENILWFLFWENHPETCQLLRNIFLKDLTKDYGTWSPWARFTKWHPLLRKVIEREVLEVRNRPVPTNQTGLFDRMAQFRQAHGEPLDIEQIAEHVFTLLIAGVDPTMIATTWNLVWLYETPDVREKLRREIEVEFENDIKNLDTRLPSKSTWLDATVKESLRMFPVVTTPSGRRLTKSATIQGHTYPPETTLLPCTYLVHRRASLYEFPDEFRPERFLNRVYRSYEYFPYGGGVRTCIGAKLADLTIKTIVSTVLRRVHFQPATDGPVVPVRHGTLLAPSDNFCLRVVRIERP